jgi:hypothetical protein
MPFEFYLQPAQEATFDTPVIEAMHAYLRALPSHQWPDGSYVLFSSTEERAADLPALMAATGNDYTHALVAVDPDDVLLSAVGDLRTNEMMYDFVIWCRQRWRCDLYEYEVVVEPEILLQAGY